MTRRQALASAAGCVAAVYGNEVFAFGRPPAQSASQVGQPRGPGREMIVPLDGIDAVVFRRNGRVVRVSPDEMLDAIQPGKEE